MLIVGCVEMHNVLCLVVHPSIRSEVIYRMQSCKRLGEEEGEEGAAVP